MMTRYLVVTLFAILACPNLSHAEENPAEEMADSHSSAGQRCAPGRQIACPCLARAGRRTSSNPIGAQVCLADGRSYSQCRCPRGADLTDVDSFEEAEAEAAREYYADAFLGFYTAFGVSIDNPALALALGVVLRMTDRWLFHVAAEWNPWASFDTTMFSPGVTSIYGVITRRIYINQWASLRSGAGGGMTWLMSGLMGNPAGSFGPYVALSLLGLELQFSNRWKLILDPSDIRIPVPSIRGVPITFHQYRFTFALEI